MKVKDHQNLQRDPNSKAIINTDVAALREYKEKRKMMESVSDSSQKIASLEKDLSDIKAMLFTLINKK